MVTFHHLSKVFAVGIFFGILHQFSVTKLPKIPSEYPVKDLLKSEVETVDLNSLRSTPLEGSPNQTVSQYPEMDPSDSSTIREEAQFFNVLSDNVKRKVYNKILDLGRKYVGRYVNVSFLKSCLENRVVPTTFRISNKPSHPSEKFTEKWTNAARNASLAWIRISIHEEEKEVKTILDEYQTAMISFSSQVPEELHHFFAKRMETRTEKILQDLQKELAVPTTVILWGLNRSD